VREGQYVASGLKDNANQGLLYIVIEPAMACSCQGIVAAHGIFDPNQKGG
jgi:hypothetical protein